MGSDKEFKHESIHDKVSIVEYLKAISEGLEKGELQLKDSDDDLVLHPHGLLNMEIKAKTGDGKAKLTLKIGWKESPGARNNGNLVIKSDG